MSIAMFLDKVLIHIREEDNKIEPINRLTIFVKSVCFNNKTTVRIGNNNKATILLERK